MTSSMHESNTSGELASPIARIEAQNALYVEPLREYLESHGCRTVINRDTAVVPHYIICVGDADFVKSFFEQTDWTASKKLAVIYEGDENDLSSVRQQRIKFYFIDPHTMSATEVRSIFTFFFTERAQIKSSRKELSPLKKKSVIITEPPREYTAEAESQNRSDKKRIADAMQAIFASKKQYGLVKATHTGIKRFQWILLGLLTLLVPVLLYALSVGAGIGLLAAGGKTLTKGESRWTGTLLGYGNSYVQTAQVLLHLGSPVFVLLGQGGMVQDQERLLSILEDVSKVESGVLTIFRTSRIVAGGIFFPEDTQQRAGLVEVTALTSEVSRVSQHLALVAAQLDSLLMSRRFPFNTGTVSRMANKGITELSRVREIVGYTEKLLALYPRIGGFRKKQTYLVLLQNSMELRPTGGFIGSLLLVTFLDGRVESLDVQDVYTADGQLKGHVDPPLAIREILGNEHWYLRDSNWDPNFSVSGEKAAWFYEKEMGVKVDGVIAISLPMVTKLLSVTGPIELLDFNERISAGNFFAKSLLYTQTDFFPGSTQKKDFLGALTNALLTRITTDRSLSAGALLHVMTESIQSRDIQFYFVDQQLQSLVTQWNWGGEVTLESCDVVAQQIPCKGDGLAIIEANLGVNKTNFFVTREVLSQITIDPDGTLEHALTLKISNDAPVLPDGSGAYQVYMRLLIPLGAEVREVSLDGALVPARDVTNAVPPPAPYWFEESGKTYSIVHIPIAVRPRQTSQLSLSWKRYGALAFDTSAIYQLTMRKQSGVSEIPWHVVLRYPGSWSSSGEGGIAKGSVLEYNTTLTKDAKFRVIFQKNL